MEYIFISGLSRKDREKFNRAIRLTGSGPQSQWLRTVITRCISSVEAKHGDLSLALTEEERWIVEVIHSGAAEVCQIAEESGVKLARVESIVGDLMERGIVREEKQGGK